MRYAETFRAIKETFREGLPTLALSCAAILSFLTLVSCGGDSCLVFTFNFPGPISTANKSCGINQTTGNLSVRVASTASSTEVPMAPNLLHIFVTLEGIEAHPEGTAGENSPGWLELAPNLVKEPVQIDLMAQPAQSCASNSISHALVAAGVYKQVRLRLAPDHPAANAAVPEQNAGGEIGFHCVVTANNKLRALTLDLATAAIRITPNRIAGGMFQVLPDTMTNLAIEFNPYSSIAAPSGEAVRIVPVFTADSDTSCDSHQASLQ